MFSFPRAARFPELKTTNYDFYNWPSASMTRYTSFGKGNRSDFTKRQKGINTTFHNVKRVFDEDNPQGLKYSFGINRDAYAKVYYESNKMIDKNIPGPGKYDYWKPFGHDAPKFTMWERVHGKSKSGSKYTHPYPGPGEYKPVITINSLGQYPTSKVRNITMIDFGADKSKRLNYLYNNSPGPGAYSLQSLMGKIFNSKYHSSQDKTMLGKYKDYDSRQHYPGPGQYITFSEFGIYQSKNAGLNDGIVTTGKKGETSTSKPKKNSEPGDTQSKPKKKLKPLETENKYESKAETKADNTNTETVEK